MALSDGWPIQVFLVAEHPDLRQSIGLLLSGEGMQVCGWAERGREALWKLPAEADLVLVGLPGGGRGGHEFLRELRARPDSPPTVVLSADDDPLSIGLAFASGARGYVPNRQASETLAHAIREVASGRSYIPSPPGGDLPAAPEALLTAHSTRFCPW